MAGRKQNLIDLDKDNNQQFVHLLAIGHWSQIVLFPRWIEYILPTNNYAFRAISKPDKNGEFEVLRRKSYHNLVSLSNDACTTKEAKEALKKQPLIVTTDLRFPKPYDDHAKQSGLEFVLRHRDLSPDSHYLFHGLEFTEEDKAKLKEYGFNQYFIWRARPTTGEGMPWSTFPEKRAKNIFLKILKDYAQQFTKADS